jgi:exonuclease SbcC
MIEYDYLLERNMGEGKVLKLTPKAIPTKIPNLLRIEGPNGIGKSTLLNIIALSFWATDSRKIHPSLLEKMGTLLNSDYQALKFTIEISSEKKDLRLISTKAALNSQEIIVQESIEGSNFKPLSHEKFQEKYNLIYDIASNPIERLYDLLKDLREEERSIGVKFSEFAGYLREVLKAIESSRNLERLVEVKQKIDDINKENGEIQDNLPNLSMSLDLLEKQAYVRFYYQYLNDYQTLSKREQDFVADNTNIEQDNKKIGKKYLKSTREIEDFRQNILQNYQEATPLIKGTLPNSQKVDFKIWKNMNPYSTDETDLNSLHNEATHLKNLFAIESEKIKKQSSFQDASVLERLITALKDFEDSPLMIPKLKVSIGELINLLKEDNEKNFMIMSTYRNIQSIDNLLTDIAEDTSSLLIKLEETKEISIDRKKTTEAVSTLMSRKNELKIIRETLAKYQKKIDYYLDKCVAKGFDETKLKTRPYKEFCREIPSNKELEYFLTLTEDQITHRISEIDSDLNKKRKRLDENKAVLGIFEKELADLKKQKPHPLESSKNEISRLMDKADELSQRLLRNYDDNIKKLIEKSVKQKDVEKDLSKKKHYAEISHYLAHRIGVFPHMDRKYKAIDVDLISGIIATEDGSIIHVNDIGTGQSQSAYLMSLLNVADDGRKIIALFDEIAMMDDNSLQPVCNKLVELYKSNRLLVGILVQKSEEFKMKAL